MAPDAARRPAQRGADLLAHVEADLAGCELTRGSATSGVVTPPSGPAFEVEIRRERRRLIDLQVLVAHVLGPASEHDAAIVLHHTGQLRRTGLAAKVGGRDRAAVRPLLERLLADGALERACLPLDFTRFRIEPHAGAWRASLELMGASHVRTVLPPSSHYVRLDEQQREALLTTVEVLHARLPGREPHPSRAGATGHLPGRRV